MAQRPVRLVLTVNITGTSPTAVGRVFSPSFHPSIAYLPQPGINIATGRNLALGLYCPILTPQQLSGRLRNPTVVPGQGSH